MLVESISPSGCPLLRKHFAMDKYDSPSSCAGLSGSIQVRASMQTHVLVRQAIVSNIQWVPEFLG